MLYSLLCDYAGDKDHCWPSQTTLAGLLGCSVSSIKTYLRELAGQRLIAVELRECRSSTYYLLKPSFLSARAGQSNSDGGEANSGYITNYRKKETNYPPTPTPPTAKEPPSTRQPRRGVGDFFSANNAFESIWNAYPRKEAKELARAVWHRLWRQGAIRIEALMKSLRRFCRSDGWNREHGRYVPQLVNWLRGQRWLDELPSSPAAVATDHDAKVRAWEAAQERRQADPDLEAVRPQFEAFLARFRDTRLRGPAWGLWTLLHKAGRAPQAHDVADASASPLDFLRQWRCAAHA
ncbi:MAG TPA: helix-turn-helix domain-containing protein [Candidatus Desulfovibrio intestinavium]|uniref:Helix-turn-helix domain-containing protein n=1 Tax=Candidatus Desulfovibrio intestinavium TaxID=2838534 RepID=A0A9D2HNS4_9BACT|nr:helix-turn-helix domain-containing protein [Candidatus Desulfovibrio intestinavium]